VESEPYVPPGALEDRPVLRVESLYKSYGPAVAVDDLTFDVGRGEILGLVGPNGAGKTTTLRTIAGVLPVQAGRILVCGFDVSKSEAEAKRCLAWVPDDPQPFDALTVAEHLEFTAELYRVPAWREHADALLERFELADRRDALGGELSRGMRQKLAFSCAWLSRPRLVLLDEPLSGLDPRGIRSAKQAIVDLAREGAAVILSSHLLELVEALGHRVLVMSRGRRVFHGTIAEARRAVHGGSLEDVFLKITSSDESALFADPRAADVETGGLAADDGEDWSSTAFDRESP